MAVRALTANRLARPPSKWACYAPWLADAVYGPEAKAVALEHLERALECLRRQIASREPAMLDRTAALCNAEVDLRFWDTTTVSDAIDDADDAGEVWEDQAIPALRQRGPHQAGREGNVQVVVGLALTRDGLPGRSWVFPGHPAAVTTSTPLQDDVRGWRGHRGVFVGESGLCSEANRQRLRRALGRDMLAVPMRQVTAVHRDGRTRAGRYRDVAHNLRGQEVYVGEGARRRRELVCHHPDEAARAHAPRERPVALVRAALAALDTRPAAHPTHACELMASRRCGRDLRMAAPGRLSLDAAQVAAEAQDDGPCVVTTTDDTLAAADVALGYTCMPLIAGGCRPMQTTGLQTRPRYHGRPHRRIAHVQRCVLAVLRQRAAEIRGQQTWRTMRQTVAPVTVVRDQMHGQTMVQSPRVTAPLAAIRQRRGIPLPKKIVEVYESVRITQRSSIHASQTPCVSYGFFFID